MNRFELEQDILNCWTITSDLDLLLELCENISDPEVNDKISNIIFGLKSIYDMRFQKCWDSFEGYIKSEKPVGPPNTKLYHGLGGIKEAE